MFEIETLARVALITRARRLLPEGAKLIYLVVTGSHSYGTSTPQSDLDVRGVYLHNPVSLLSMHRPSDEIPDPIMDLKLWSLGKFYQQLIKGSPNATEMLFSPEDCVLFKDDLMDPTIISRSTFISSATLEAYKGMMGNNQHLSTRQYKNLDEPATKKAAGHHLRLAIELLNLVLDGRPKVRLPEDFANEVRSARTQSVEITGADAEWYSTHAISMIDAGMAHRRLGTTPPEQYADYLHTAIYQGLLTGVIQ